jgi:hypothetical protein
VSAADAVSGRVYTSDSTQLQSALGVRVIAHGNVQPVASLAKSFARAVLSRIWRRRILARNQLSYDLWHARGRARAVKVKPFSTPEMAE